MYLSVHNYNEQKRLWLHQTFTETRCRFASIQEKRTFLYCLILIFRPFLFFWLYNSVWIVSSLQLLSLSWIILWFDVPVCSKKNSFFGQTKFAPQKFQMKTFALVFQTKWMSKKLIWNRDLVKVFPFMEEGCWFCDILFSRLLQLPWICSKTRKETQIWQCLTH